MSAGEDLARRIAPVLDKLRGRHALDVPMKKYTWFQVGGPADVLVQPADEEDLAGFLRELPETIPVTVVGVGPNLRVRDGGLEGVVIRLPRKGFDFVRSDGGNRLVAGTAVLDKDLAAAALEHGLGGFAFYHGIPGGIGGALRMNAGANGTETTNRVVEVNAIDRKGNRHVLSRADMGYTYRHSAAPADLIFTSAVFEGEPAPRE